MTGQVLGLGCKLKVESSVSPAAATNIGHLRSYDGPQFTTGEQEVTDGDSTGREHLPTFPDPGSLPFVIFWQPGLTTQEALLTKIQTVPQTLDFYWLQPTSDTTFYFRGQAFVRDLSFNGGAQNEIFQANAALRLSGAWTLEGPVP